MGSHSERITHGENPNRSYAILWNLMPRAEKKQVPRYFDVILNVLGYQEEGEWVALALEMDLRGYGKTFEDALRELQDLVEAQIAFALFKGRPEMAWKPAEPVYWQLFAQVREDRFLHLADETRRHLEYRVAGMPIPPPHVIQTLKGGWFGPSSTAS